jgi:Flp pilus assembly protein TadB
LCYKFKKQTKQTNKQTKPNKKKTLFCLALDVRAKRTRRTVACALATSRSSRASSPPTALTPQQYKLQEQACERAMVCLRNLVSCWFFLLLTSVLLTSVLLTSCVAQFATLVDALLLSIVAAMCNWLPDVNI